MNIAIIGGGNLGVAIAKGIREEDPNASVGISRRKVTLIKHLEAHNIIVESNNTKLIENAKLVIIAVKPDQLEEVLHEINPVLKQQIIVSVVTGKSLEFIRHALPNATCIFRAMPNIAISQKQSMTCLAHQDANVNQQQQVISLFDKLGETVFIEEEMMDGATVLSACGIAFAMRYIRASMQGGIQIGFDSETALKIAAQTVKGAASLLLNESTHPEKEIDKVTTPQGCTIAGLNEMEHKGFSSALIKGLLTSYNAIDEIKKKR